jgi:CRISPR-associated protein Csb1
VWRIADSGEISNSPHTGYNIDELPDGSNVCLIDSFGSQANRIEPLFTSFNGAALT